MGTRKLPTVVSVTDHDAVYSGVAGFDCTGRDYQEVGNPGGPYEEYAVLFRWTVGLSNIEVRAVPGVPAAFVSASTSDSGTMSPGETIGGYDLEDVNIFTGTRENAFVTLEAYNSAVGGNMLPSPSIPYVLDETRLIPSIDVTGPFAGKYPYFFTLDTRPAPLTQMPYTPVQGLTNLHGKVNWSARVIHRQYITCADGELQETWVPWPVSIDVTLDINGLSRTIPTAYFDVPALSDTSILGDLDTSRDFELIYTPTVYVPGSSNVEIDSPGDMTYSPVAAGSLSAVTGLVQPPGTWQAQPAAICQITQKDDQGVQIGDSFFSQTISGGGQDDPISFTNADGSDGGAILYEWDDVVPLPTSMLHDKFGNMLLGTMKVDAQAASTALNDLSFALGPGQAYADEYYVDLRGANGVRYADIDIAINLNGAANSESPQLWFGALPVSIYDTVTPPSYYNSFNGYAIDESLIAFYVQTVLDGVSDPYGWWWSISYDRTLPLAGETQTVRIDLAHPILAAAANDANSGPLGQGIYVKGLGKGLPYISSDDTQGTSDERSLRDILLQYAVCVLASDAGVDSPVTVNVTSVRLVHADETSTGTEPIVIRINDIITLQSSNQYNSVVLTGAPAEYINPRDTQAYEVYSITDAYHDYYTRNWPALLVVERDHAPSAALADYLVTRQEGYNYSEPVGYKTIQEAETAMNTLGNDLVWIYEDKSGYDVSAVQIRDVIPSSFTWGINGNLSSTSFNLTFRRKSAPNDYIGWTGEGKMHHLTQWLPGRWTRGLIFSDFSNTAFTGWMRLSVGALNPSTNLFTVDTSQVQPHLVFVEADGYWIDYMPYSAKPLPAAVQHFRLEFAFTDLLACSDPSATALGMAPGPTTRAFIRIDNANTLSALRILAPVTFDSCYDHARNVIWQVASEIGGYIAARLLVGGYDHTAVEEVSGDYIATLGVVLETRRLPVRGLAPSVKMLSHAAGVVRILYKGVDQAFHTAVTHDGFVTIAGQEMNLFPEYPAALEGCMCVDEATGTQYFFATIPLGSLFAVAADPNAVQDDSGANMVMLCRKYDAQGKPLQFLPNPDAQAFSLCQTIYCNILYISSGNFGRPGCFFAEPNNRLILAYGPNYFYSDDHGDTWSSVGGAPQLTLSNFPRDPFTANGMYPTGNYVGGAAGDDLTV